MDNLTWYGWFLLIVYLIQIACNLIVIGMGGLDRKRLTAGVAFWQAVFTCGWIFVLLHVGTHHT